MKKGISAVVATVLIILITVAAITLIWTAVIPMIKDNATSYEQNIDLSVATSEGYTVYDGENNAACVQVKRGSDGANLSGVQIIFSFGGESCSAVIYQAFEKNQMQKFCFNLSGYLKPDSVSVVPIFPKTAKKQTERISSTISPLPTGTILGENLIALQCGKVIEEEPSCIPKTCSDYYGEGVCGSNLENGTCSGTLNCNSCLDGKNCEGGRCVNPTIPITGCAVLDQANTVYVLDSDFENNSLNSGSACFNITAENVTLNCSGKTFTSNSSRVTGVYSDKPRSEIRDCKFELKNEEEGDYGIRLGSGAVDSKILDVEVISSRIGVDIEADRTMIDNLQLDNSYDTGLFISAKNVSVENVHADNKGGAGIYLGNCDGITISDSTASGNLKGIWLWDSYNTKILSSSANGNSDWGILINGGTGNNVSECRVEGSGDYGDNDAGIFIDSDGNVVENSVVLYNYYIGLYISSSDNLIINNTIINNSINLLLSGSRNTIINNTISYAIQPHYFGIYLGDESSSNFNNTFKGNYICGNFGWDWICDVTYQNFDLGNTYNDDRLACEGWLNESARVDCPSS
jgi:parallel beta-helix repeat protein